MQPLCRSQEDQSGGSAATTPVPQLLEQNYAILNQFKQNMAQYRIAQNTDLLIRFRCVLEAAAAECLAAGP